MENTSEDNPLPEGSANNVANNTKNVSEDEDLYDPGRGSPNHRVKPRWWMWPSKLYYRYKLSTGVYMLGPLEETVLHFFFFLGAYFVVTYGLQFYSEMIKGGYLDEAT